MRRDRISETISNIDQKYIDEAAIYTAEGKTAHRFRWIRWGAAAACAAAVIIAGTFALLLFREADTKPVLLGGLSRPYKDVDINSQASDMEWPWEYKTIYEQYLTMTFAGREYNGRVSAIDASQLGDVLGTCEAMGYDYFTEQEYRRTFEVRQIRGVAEDILVAVDMDGEFYVFLNSEYAPPATLGELIDSCSLPQTLKLSRFTVYEGYTEMEYYILENDDPVWQLLSDCRNAQLIEDDQWNFSERNYISFTATSETLGIYKRAFYVTADGYVLMNIFNWNYIYYIGENAAGQMIEYAVGNAAEASYEPYKYTLAGKLVEIGDDYILVDDSVLCKDPDDGMVFRVPTDDLRIKRCIDCFGIDTGDMVVISFTGEIDVASDNTVCGAYSISEAAISNGRLIYIVR